MTGPAFRRQPDRPHNDRRHPNQFSLRRLLVGIAVFGVFLALATRYAWFGVAIWCAIAGVYMMIKGRVGIGFAFALPLGGMLLISYPASRAYFSPDTLESKWQSERLLLHDLDRETPLYRTGFEFL